LNVFTLSAPTTRKPAFKLDVLTSSNRVGSAPHCTHPRGHITLCASGDRNVGLSSVAFGLYGDTEPFRTPEYSQHVLHCTGLGALSELGFGKVSSTAPQNGHADTSSFLVNTINSPAPPKKSSAAPPITLNPK
jgi:hypothetical protein